MVVYENKVVDYKKLFFWSCVSFHDMHFRPCPAPYGGSFKEIYSQIQMSFEYTKIPISQTLCRIGLTSETYKEPISTVLKDINHLMKCTRRGSYNFRLDFVLSNRPHFTS